MGSTLDDGQVAYYLFSGNAEDVSGADHHGTVEGAVLTSDRNGTPDSAYRFNGLDQRIDLGFGPGDSYESLTINVWVRSLEVEGGFGGLDANAGHGTGYWGSGNFVAVYDTEGQPGVESFRLLGAGDGYGNIGQLHAEVGSAYHLTTERFDDAEWHMLTLAYDGATARFYIDGTLINEFNTAVTIQPSFNWMVGCRLTDTGETYPGFPYSEHAEGDIDDVGIWNRALTADEVLELLDYVPGADLLASYSFSGNAMDESGHEHHGTVEGAELTSDRFGGTDSAYSFNGLDQRIDLGFGPGDAYSALAVNVWVRSHGPEAGFGGHDANAGHATGTWGNGNFVCVMETEEDYFAETFRLLGRGHDYGNPGLLHAEIGNVYHETPERIDDGFWHMLTLSWDGTLAQLYVDGQLNHEFEAPILLEPTFNWMVGCRLHDQGEIYPGFPYSEHAEGDIDDLAIWGRNLTPEEITELYDGFVQAAFSASTAFTETGETVTFTNQSTGTITGYLWDFGDGQTSTDESPDHIYTAAGDYTVTLTVQGEGYEIVATRELTVIGPEPRILSVSDVPEDQGGRVYIRFLRSAHDDDGIESKALESYSVERLDGGQWVNVTSGNAYNQNEYVFEVNTLADGQPTDFRIIAAMSEGNYLSEVAQGQSEDNIAPAAPEQVAWLQFGVLQWQGVEDEDLAYYRVYGATGAGQIEGAQEVGTTISTNLALDVQTLGYPAYFVVAVDDAGLESDAEMTFVSSGTADPSLPRRSEMKGNFPNPFNPSTTIRYATARDGLVALTVYDVSGRRVATLIQEVQMAGEHTVVWDGRDDRGQQVSSGMYFARLNAGGETSSSRMVLLK